MILLQRFLHAKEVTMMKTPLLTERMKRRTKKQWLVARTLMMTSMIMKRMTPLRYAGKICQYRRNSLPTPNVLERLARITKIEYNFMEDYDPSPANAWDVFRWLSKRTTSRPEDLSYCLLVLLDIQIPIAYGEGEERAFYRVQVECSHHVEDRSLFLWNGSRSRWNSMFADDPSAFQDSEMEYPGKPWTLSSNCLFDSHPTRTLDPSFSLTNCGLRIMVVLHPVEFVHVSTYPAKHEKHEYVLTIFKTGDTKVTLRWQGKSPASSKVTARWKVAVVGPANMPPSRSYDGKAHRNLLDTLDFRPRYLYRSLI